MKTKMQGNVVGSSNTHFWNLFQDQESLYILGLWCADGYHRTSSIGISNINEDIVQRFQKFLLRLLPRERLRLRIYYPKSRSWSRKINVEYYNELADKVVYYPSIKASVAGLHLYVNSRPLLRMFVAARQNVLEFQDQNLIAAYFAGRFDGDGSIAKDLRSDCRIVYSSLEEAVRDLKLLKRLGFKKAKIYKYRKARTICLYISRYEAGLFLDKIKKYSILVPKMCVRTP